jgi:SAM-dependent methyltransferase
MQIGRKLISQARRFLQGPQNASPSAAISADYRVIKNGEIGGSMGWQEAQVAERQHQAFVPLLEDARSGRPRLDFVVAARAIQATNLSDPLIVEVGCGSGYYSEVVPMLLGTSLRYVGIDYATSMTSLAHRIYPSVPFLTGDACNLPLASNCCDVLLSGTSLMHIADYRRAIAESIRVAREWLIFHTVPVMKGRSTTFLKKLAYGEQVVEVIFNQAALEGIFNEEKLSIEAVFESIPYDVSEAVGERTSTLTYLCHKRKML